MLGRTSPTPQAARMSADEMAFSEGLEIKPGLKNKSRPGFHDVTEVKRPTWSLPEIFECFQDSSGSARGQGSYGVLSLPD